MIPWDKIIDAVVELIVGCLGARSSETDVLDRFARPRIGDRLRAERLVRRELNLNWGQWRAQRSTIRAQMEAERAALLDDVATNGADSAISIAYLTAKEALGDA